VYLIKTPSYRVKVVSLDLDDTLWPIEPIINTAEKHFYSFAQENLSRISDALTIEALREKRLAFMMARTELHHNMTALRQEYINALLSEYEYSASFVEEIMARFMVDRNRVDFYPETLDTLEKLAERYTLVACTNGNADIFETAAAPYFSHSISSEDIGVGKPDKRMFNAVCKAAACRAPEVVHIGDNPQTDVLGALHAGMHSVWFNPDQLDWPHPQKPHTTISKLDQLLPLLQ